MVLAPLAIVLAGIVVYANSLSVPFLFDDRAALIALPPPGQWTLGRLVGGTLRPVVQLSLASNLALGSARVEIFHVFNLLVHLLATLTLYGVLRRTLLLMPRWSQEARRASALAAAASLLWMLHPLQTQSVTYIIQRAESLMGLWYLLTLYTLLRGATGTAPVRWHIACVACCALGMLSKAAMVSAPLVALLYDRVFLAGSWRGAWQRRRTLYLALAATWGLLLLLLRQLPATTEWTAGFAGRAPTVVEYLRTQPGVILHYLRLVVWPSPLVFDYAWPIAKTAAAIWPPTLIVAALLLWTGYALVRHPPSGFLGAWLFLTLAPSSSVFPIADAAFEYRMYLPLAAPLVAIVLGAYGVLDRMTRGVWRHRLMAGLMIGLSVGLGVLTVRRNHDYRSEETLWRDTIAKRPHNARAHHNLGRALAHAGRLEEAIGPYQEALRLSPGFAIAHNNLGVVLRKLGRWSQAAAHYRAALVLEPTSPQLHNNLAVALKKMGRLEEARAQYAEALRLDDRYAEAHRNLGVLLAEVGQRQEALQHLRRALEINPADAAAQHSVRALLSQPATRAE